MKTRVPLDIELLEAAARMVDLPLSDERARQLVPVMDGILQALDSLDHAGLGETPPAFGYRADWRL